MGKIERAVFDAGPLIHLAEIDQLNLLDIVKEKVAPEVVIKEFRGHRIEDIDLFVLSLNDKGKEHSDILMKEYHLDIGEAEAISLAKQENIRYFFTDDFYARDVAKELNILVHGTLGIVIRAYRESVIDRNTACDIMDELYANSSLFVTSKIVTKGKMMLKEFEKP